MTRLFTLAAICLMLCLPARADQTRDLSGDALAWLNAARAEAGRAAVAPADALTRAAAAHARDLARSGRFSHTGSDDSTVGQRVRAQGYGFCFVAENIAKGQGSLDAVLRGWMASDGHRRNLLADQAQDFGLVRGPGALWVMVLARPGC